MATIKAALCLAATMTAGSLGFSERAAGQALPAYAVSRNDIFIAGISSGGFMAVQMDVAYSSVFKGAAIYAGGPDYCAEGSLETALTACSQNVPTVDASSLVATTQAWSAQGSIDPVSNLQAQPVYLWSGLLDTTVRQPVMDALQSYYEALGANVFHYDNDFLAAHGWESPYGPLNCGTQASPYVIGCHQGSDQASAAGSGNAAPGPFYDSVAVWLTRFLGTLKPKNTGTLNGTIVPFDQNQFAPDQDAAAISMDNTGYAFVPADCTGGKRCRLILALHGCNQSYSAIGMTFIQTAGINEWADTNQVIVLYPQTIATAATGYNPQGCWNWWGYLNDPNYALKDGPQMQTLYRMVAQASSGPGSSRKP